MAAITDVPSILNDNNGNVRKWGTQLLAIADYSAAMPDPFFDTATNKPNQLPEGFKVMGYISTDGAKMSRGIESADTSAVQESGAGAFRHHRTYPHPAAHLPGNERMGQGLGPRPARLPVAGKQG